MNTKRKNKSYISRIKTIIGLIMFFAALLVFCKVKAESITDISNGGTLSDSDQQKLDELKRKAEVYRQIIEIKEKQGETLSNQLSITDTNIEQVQNQIDMSSQQIDDLNSQIIRIQTQTKEKEALIESQKKLLGQIIQTYYEASKASPAAVYLSGGSISSFMVTKDRIAQTGDKIKELVDSIMETKKNLEQQSAQLDQKKGEFVDKNQQLQDQNNNLSSIKQQRQTLLSQTQGEEVRYRQLLANVEKQKQELFDFSQASNLDDVLKSVNSYKKPNEKYWDSDNFYAQWDSRWGNMKIGGTKYLMKDFGCAITSVAMVYKSEGKSYTPKTILTSSDFIKKGEAIIYWPDAWYKTSFNKNTIDKQLKNGNDVIVHITKGNTDGHFVVIHHYDTDAKSYVVNDPYFGANIYLETSMSLLGKLGTNMKTSINYIIISG